MASIEAAAHPAHVPYLYYVAGADGCGEQVFSTTHARVRSQRRGLPGRGLAQRRQASRLQARSDATPGRPRLAGRAQPLARDAQRRAAALGMEDWRYQLLPVPPELFAETARALAAAGLRGGERDDPPQAGGARAGRHGQRGGERDRRGEHAHVLRGRRDRGREHRRPGLARRALGNRGLARAA